jgi:hypothetical protein
MRYMMLVRSDARKNQGPPDPKLMEAIGKLTEEMNRAGTTWDGEGEVRQLADFEQQRAWP